MRHKYFEKRIFIVVSILLIVILALSFKYYYSLQAKKPAPPRLPRLPKVAIVLDDWGYNLNNIDLLRFVDIPLTLAILPNLKYSQEMAREVRFKNRQIILHMPMEPSRTVRLEKNTVTTDMNASAISAILNNDLKNLPGVKGISNHMGSKFTADKKAMTIFLRQLKAKNLYFLDNVSCSDSVCREAANNVKVKLAERDVYLDNLNNKDYIKGQLAQLIDIAKKRGYALGTGHDRKRTLEVIKEVAPTLKGKIKFVFVSELAK